MDILNSILLAFGSFFAHPLLYVGLLTLYIMATRRVKKERSFFHTRVYSRMADVVVPFWSSLVAGIILSVLFILIGLVISWPVLLVIAVTYILLFLTLQLRWLSPSYTLGLTIIIITLLPFMREFEWVAPYYSAVHIETVLPGLVVLMGALILTEGLLINRNGAVYTSPRLERATRGRWVGFHLAERLWIVPVVLLIPGGLIPALDFWPVIPFFGMDFQPLLLPFLIGFKQKLTSTLPMTVLPKVGRDVVILGLILLAVAVGTMYVSWLALVAAILAILGREFLWQRTTYLQAKGSAIFAEKTDGCTILGVLPGSLAEKMNLEIGETIVKVNGQHVSDETSFYEALQQNSAFCKLDVLDYDQEVRFEQGALYDSEHHQLGVLLVKTDKTLSNSVT
ncbi:PDZ domain-containing protein [Alkalicoccobacillus porphyridii]|uniref:PDZ domain-containing protein n=1 Tax=Alkalicoccobacillus porphyridii TaxID=2597270 RepID=A0A554A3Q4_9BACI|nr:PDZ domain-containing protein [Alkalicoccobacillus porphyridii]TSB48322.1 PDZ domain-containing protein [Alkalicoccobacillus porphyridii]